ncbi:hypothetical protein F5887DRAFT_985531 [Amanita rubescens]|nr:hypothetical protein F5887DRAFT_985531 [Amanita rubescens]
MQDNSTEYLNLAVCPPGLPQWMNNTDSVITVYVQNNSSTLGNQTCTLKPLLLSVNVTYNRDGFVTLVPMTRQLLDIPAYMSIMVNAAHALEQHFVDAQRISGNNIIDSINLLVGENPPYLTTEPRALFRDILANYIRGVFEYSVTAFRYTTLYKIRIGTHYYSLTKNSPAVVWGQVPELRLIIIISPLAIMITTISIFLFSLHKAQNLTLDHIASFDPMNPLHVIAACGSGNVQTVAFPGYSKHITSFSKDLEVQLPECHARNESAGFQFFRRRH